MKPKTTGLGRGLDALIDNSRVEPAGSSSISEVALDLIVANPNQPRRNFEEETIDELAASIKELGVISPITLSKQSDDKYLIVAGERRFRAAKKAGLTAIPAYIRTVQDEQMMEMALIENIQREDLDAIEIALAYQRLMDDYQLTQERMSARVGKKRATIANYLRLLRLPAEVQMGLRDRKIDMGHARALLSLELPTDQIKLYERILAEGLNVRQVENIVKNWGKTKPNPNPVNTLPELQRLQEKLGTFFGTPVTMQMNRSGKGKMTISFASDQELQAILAKLDARR